MKRTLSAPSYALLQASVECWKCGEATPVTSVWVPSFVDYADVDEPGDEPEAGDAATLHGIQDLDDQVAAHVREAAPWLKPGRSETANATYWANHCQACGVLQGDYFVTGVNGPFFPQFRAEADALELIPGRGPLSANATAAQSEWMDWIAERLPV
ncbi:TPA: hypothetical protein ACG4NT_000436 [Stenotrophomonas maltophilia]|uniref:hypothetical protein n=1 Tax=Stenotrophomonas TaxID=40323 RepID=UPI000586945F|nr:MULTISPECIES: hypothetical protein [Stenotrophomonas]PZT35867.1 hypothetical protein A7X97_13630 [Stenotrophomonas sepilia]